MLARGGGILTGRGQADSGVSIGCVAKTDELVENENTNGQRCEGIYHVLFSWRHPNKIKSGMPSFRSEYEEYIVRNFGFFLKRFLLGKPCEQFRGFRGIGGASVDRLEELRQHNGSTKVRSRRFCGP